MDGMGNYFLMLGIAMGPQIRPDFASIEEIFRRCHFLLFVFLRRAKNKYFIIASSVPSGSLPGFRLVLDMYLGLGMDI